MLLLGHRLRWQPSEIKQLTLGEREDIIKQEIELIEKEKQEMDKSRRG